MANLTSKELTAIGEQLDYEQLLIKKFKAYSCQTNDQQLKSKCDQIASKHQEHYNRLLNQLN